MAGEVVKAFVSLKPGFEPRRTAHANCLALPANTWVGGGPKGNRILPALPRTRSGKIMRRLLKARELGLPEGDTSTLEAGA